MTGLAVHAATITWTNAASGGWNAATNWNPNSVPGASDTVFITNAGVTVSLNGTTSAGAIILGTNGAGTATLSLNNQTLTLHGPLTVNPSGSFTVSSGALVGSNAVVNGTMGWTGGTLGGILTLASGSTLNITTANPHDLPNCIMTNNGTVVWNSGAIRSGGGGTTIHNYGLWDAQSDQLLTTSGYGGTTVFNNYGTLRKSGGASKLANNTLFQSIVFNQLAGVIDVQNGTNGLQLSLQGGGNFTGGYITTNVNGLTVFSSGNFNLNGTVTGTNTWQNVGNLVGTNVINGALTWIGGVWSGATVTIPNNSVVLVGGGGGNNDMDATVVTNYGKVTWASGLMRGGHGAAIYNYSLWEAQSDQQLNSAYGGATVFNNFGTFRKSGGVNNMLFAGNVLFNQPSGVLDVQTGNVIFQGSGNFTGGYITTNSTGTTYFTVGNFNLNGTATGSNVVENGGNLVGVNVITGALNWVAGVWNNAVVTITTNSTVTVAGGGGLNDMPNCIVTNNGTVTWASGQIRGGSGAGTFIHNYGLWEAQSDQQLSDAYGVGTVFNNYGTFRKTAGSGNTIFASGVLFNQPGGLLNVQKGNVLLQGSGNFTGGSISNSIGATTYLNGGNFNLNGAATIGNVVENPGNLVGVNVINGYLKWVAGNWNGTTVTILTNSTVVIAGGGGLNDFNNCTLTNFGTVIWASGQLRGGSTPGTTIYNYGLWNAQGDYALNNAFGGAGTVFNNFGTFRKELTAGTTALIIPFNNTGKLDAQDGDIALLNTYTLANGTRMGFGLGGWLGNGSISLSGAASFTGSASVNINGYFWPGVGNSFNLLNYTTASGVLFTNTVLPPPFTWQSNYNSTAYAISVVARPAVTNTASTNLFSSVINPTTLYLAWPGDHTGWRLQSQTNSLGVGINTNWTAVPGSSVTNEVFMPIVKTNGTVFFRMIYP